MSDSKLEAQAFRALHVRGRPLVLFNIWDPGSAKTVTAAGAKAIATGSWSVATAHGSGDGEKLALDLVLGNLRRIVAATELPVSVDIESGYGKSPEEVGRTIASTIEAGAIGCNIEDSFPENGKLRDVAEQVKRIGHARASADRSGAGYFINARTDVFFQSGPDQHDTSMLQAAIDRARAYADAGADGIFAPGLVDKEMIARLVDASPIPVNIMVSERTPSLAVLSDAGVARVSHGAGPYAALMKTLDKLARQAMTAGPDR